MKKILTTATIALAITAPAMAKTKHHSVTRDVVRNYHLSQNSGTASVYGLGEKLNAKTKSGEYFNPGGMTVASPTLPMGTRVRITNHKTGKSVIARVNDRGPAKWTGRIVDLTPRVAGSIGVHGLGHVSVDVI